MALLLVLCCGLSLADSVDPNAVAAEIVRSTNTYRIKQGVPKLVQHSALTKAAVKHAQSRGAANVRNVITAEGITPKTLGRNSLECWGIAPNEVASYFLKSCFESPKQTSRLGNSRYSHTGVAVAVHGDKYSITQIFAADLGFEARVVDSNASTTETKQEIIAQKVFELTNERRRDAQLPEFQPDAFLSAAANGHSEEMLRMNYFSHNSPVPGRTKVRDRVNKAGSDPYRVAENIYQCSGYAKETVALRSILSWMQSAGHRKNILDSRLTKMGVGVYEKNGSFYFTQVFSGDS